MSTTGTNPPALQPIGQVGQAANAVKADVVADAASVRAEYDKLSEASKGKFHQLLNDLENLEQTTLSSLHNFFGAKK